jgi:hypothetical protein
MAVDGRPGPTAVFVPLASLLEVFLIKLIGDFLPLDCAFPVVRILVSISTTARRTSHII